VQSSDSGAEELCSRCVGLEAVPLQLWGVHLMAQWSLIPVWGTVMSWRSQAGLFPECPVEGEAGLQRAKAVGPGWPGHLGPRSSAQCTEMVLAGLMEHGQCWGHVLGPLLSASSVPCLGGVRDGEEDPRRS